MKASELRTRPVRVLTTTKGQQVRTWLTDRECIQMLRHGEEHQRLPSFGVELLAQASVRGLTDRQWPYAHQMALELLPPAARPEGAQPAQPATTEHVDLSAVRTMLDTAASNGIQHPRIVFELEQGRMQVARAGERSRAPGSITVTSGGSYESSTFYGRVHLDGRWEPARSGCAAWVLQALRDLQADPAGFTGAYGRRTGSCCFCNRALSTAESLAVGYGPVCADKYGLPWGEVEPEPPSAAEIRKAERKAARRRGGEANAERDAARWAERHPLA